MRKINLVESIEVNAGPEKAWEIIGPNFVNIGVWGPGIFKSWKNDSLEASITDAPIGGRFCDLGKQGIMDERIIHYDKDRFEITWSAIGEKLPGFVRNLQNALKVEKIDEQKCRVTTNITANAVGLMGTLMGGAIQKNFARLLPVFVNAWKLYAETGTVTETKQKELAEAPN